MHLSNSMITSIQEVSQRLNGLNLKWLIGGSSGLLLHRVELGQSPRDLDLYLDGIDVEPLFQALQACAIDKPEYSETPIYASVLSHYKFGDMVVEAVGDFRVHACRSSYRVEAAYLWERYGDSVQAGNAAVKLMPLAHELLFNLLRQRPDRYECIAKAMLMEPDRHMPALLDLLSRNSWSDEFLHKLDELLGKKL